MGGLPVARVQPTPDYAPPPRAIFYKEEIFHDESTPAVESYVLIGGALATSGDLYRATPYGGGLIVAYPARNVAQTPVLGAADLLPIIVDCLRVRVVKDGKIKGGFIPASHLKTMLRSEAFLKDSGEPDGGAGPVS